MTELVIPLTVPEGRRRTITDIDRTPHEIQRCEDNGSAVPADTAWPARGPLQPKHALKSRYWSMRSRMRRRSASDRCLS